MTTANLSWTLPATRTDGTPLPLDEIGSVEIFDGAVQIFTVTAAPFNSVTTPPLGVGPHVFTAVLVDTAGTRSEASAPASVVVPAPPLAAPNPVTGLTATLNS